MRDWFDGLEQRERGFVIAGAVVVAVALLWSLVWMPVSRGYTSRSEAIDTWQRSLTALRPLKGQAAATPANRRNAGGSQTPVVIIDQTLRARGLDSALQRSQPTTSTGIRVEFENVAFDDLVLWLDDLGSDYDMHVQAGSFSTTVRSAPGRVSASLTLEKAQ